MYHIYARRGKRWIEEANAQYASEAMRLFNYCDCEIAYIINSEGAIYTSRNLEKVIGNRD